MFSDLRFLRRAAAATLAAALASSAALASPLQERAWLTSWMASQQPVWQAHALPLPTGVPAEMADQTVRQVVRLSAGGDRLRVVLSNPYGRQPLVVGAAQLAPHAGGGRIELAGSRAVTFGGRPTVTIPAGQSVASDAIALATPALGELALSLYLPQRTALESFHWDGRQSAWLAAGNATAQAMLAAPQVFSARIVVSEVQVEAPAGAAAVVALGDSITEGNGSTPDTNRRWPDLLAQRLAADGVAVLNAGISGGRLLRDGMGASALARLDRDVLSQAHVRTVIAAIGINDIAWPGSTFAPHDAVPRADELIAGYRRLIARAHARGVRVIGATITPFAGALRDTPIRGYDSPGKEAVRLAVNDWIRHGGAFNAVLDFDAAVRDPARPEALLPAFDSGDHLHPGDAGYRAMAAQFDLALPALAGQSRSGAPGGNSGR
ncbi:SGNH/GDSL hydrolase family protein [Cupriavidus taiwanensis]|uniref:SGNH/GDSL hydrolase family protein n=1 Tax=Cupriavidus taiwanensis TaxID=164546 RepID=UPI000E13BEE8|nr:SGNH/GDSL hydrolase family protein [Cupriavidus taiwanensis]SOZ28700.1 Lysophospholipase L1 [Cupriavidus taiwanensis]SPA33988.1 Lysophospholipase L1 [Cupriavidus taiwanensis]